MRYGLSNNTAFRQRSCDAPWQELSDAAAALVGYGHVSGLFVRPVRPLAIMLFADRVPIESTHSKMR
jgi:hypothetical protein